jgi:hypothetical protein
MGRCWRSVNTISIGRMHQSPSCEREACCPVMFSARYTGNRSPCFALTWLVGLYHICVFTGHTRHVGGVYYHSGVANPFGSMTWCDQLDLHGHPSIHPSHLSVALQLSEMPMRDDHCPRSLGRQMSASSKANQSKVLIACCASHPIKQLKSVFWPIG